MNEAGKMHATTDGAATTATDVPTDVTPTAPHTTTNTRVLVTGGAGYIGSVVAAHLIEAGHRVTILDDLSTGYSIGIPDGADLVEGRVHETAEKVLDRSFAAVLHFAAFSQVGESVANPGKYWENNTVGSYRLLEAVRRAGVPRLVFSSTAAVYGNPESVPIPETARTAPTSPYGATKLAVDAMISDYCAAHGLGAVSLRYFNVAGASHGLGERHDPESHLIPLLLDVALGRREYISIYGDDYPTADGTCVRDYLHVADLAEAHLLALRAAQPRQHAICNLGNGNGFSVLEVIEAARRVTGHPVPARLAPRRAGDPATLVAGAQRARELLGWQPRRTSLDEMIADAWQFKRAAHATAHDSTASPDAAPSRETVPSDAPAPHASTPPPATPHPHPHPAPSDLTKGSR